MGRVVILSIITTSLTSSLFGMHLYHDRVAPSYRHGHQMVVTYHKRPIVHVRRPHIIVHRRFYRPKVVVHRVPLVHKRVIISKPAYYSCPSSSTTLVPSSTLYRYQVGDIALNLPEGAMEVIINGKRYYEAQGQYFEEMIRDGKIVYKVVSI